MTVSNASIKTRLFVPVIMLCLLAGSAYLFSWWATSTGRVRANDQKKSTQYPQWYVDADLPLLSEMTIRSGEGDKDDTTLEMTTTRTLDDLNQTFHQELIDRGWSTVSRPGPNTFIYITTYTRADRTLQIDLANAGDMRIVRVFYR